MTRTMSAYRMTGWEKPGEIVEVPVPRPGPGQVLVRVSGCGLCHSDVAMRHIPREIGEMLGWAMPYTLGHETGGRVAELGDGVVGFDEGDPVVLVSAASCGVCWYCMRGLDNSCPSGVTGRGYGRDGGLADYVLVDDTRALVRLKKLDPRTAGPLTDAGATSYHAVHRALPRIVPGGTAVVFGAGGLGVFAVQFLRILTAARVVAVDLDKGRLEKARELGAHETLIGVGESTAADVQALTDGRGADAVLDFVGVDATIGAGVASVRPGGTFGLVGASGGKLDKAWFGTLPKDGEVFTFQGATIADVHEVVELADRGLIHNDVEEFPFSRVGEAYAELDAGTLRARAVVVFDE